LIEPNRLGNDRARTTVPARVFLAGEPVSLVPKERPYTMKADGLPS